MAVPAPASGRYDLLVWGATGFTGRLVAEHLAADYQGKATWALGGRNEERLLAVRNALAAQYPAAKDVPVVVGDLSDAASMDRVARAARVLMSTAGPFSLLGTPVVEACLRNGTHYCDITGEVAWVKGIIAAHHDEAVRRGVKLVPFCGYDSIPADLGTLLVVDHIRRQQGRSTASVKTVVGASVQGLSGGSLASAMSIFADRGAAADPHALAPPERRCRGDERDYFLGASARRWLVGRVPELRVWTMPFGMAPINTRVVRRSNALLGCTCGEPFSYSEEKEVPNVLVAVVGSLFMWLGIWAIVLLPPLRALLRRFGPKPGEGLSKPGWRATPWSHRLVAKPHQAPGGASAPVTVIASVKGKRDPGYWEAARMLLESGLCLALQDKELREAGLMEGGVLTPATAMGHVLIRRLQAAGIEFNVVNELASGQEAVVQKAHAGDPHERAGLKHEP